MNEAKLIKSFTKATDRWVEEYTRYQDNLYGGDEFVSFFTELILEDLADAGDRVEELFCLAESLNDEDLLERIRVIYSGARRRMRIAEMEAKLRRF